MIQSNGTWAETCSNGDDWHWIEKRRRNEDSVTEFWHQVHKYVHSRDSRRKREKGAKNIFKDIIAENFSNLGKESDTQAQESESPQQD